MDANSRKVLVVGSGWFTASGSVNHGDRAQLQNAVRKLNELGVRPIVVAYSTGLRLRMDGAEESFDFLDYLLTGTSSASPYRRALTIAVRVLRLWITALFTFHRAGSDSPTHRAANVLAELEGADAVLVSGNGTFSDPYIRGTGLLWFTFLVTARFVGRPVYMTGQQIGPFGSGLSMLIAKAALGLATIVGVRELESYDCATRLGVPANKLIVTGDEAWTAGASSESRLAELRDSGLLPVNYIVAQVRFDRGTGLGEADAPLFADCIDAASAALQLPVVFVALQARDQHSEDLVAARVVMQEQVGDALLFDVVDNPADIKAVVRAAALAIGVSNHFCVFAASEGTRTIALYRSAYLRHKLVGLARLWPERITALELEPNIGTFIAAAATEKLAVTEQTRSSCPSVEVAPDRVYKHIAEMLGTTVKRKLTSSK